MASQTAATGQTGGERIVRETGIDARIAAIVEPALGPMGFRLVRVRLSGQNGLTLQIMAERLDGSMTVEDCEELSRALSPLLDVEDPVDQAYHLEVSSPGIDRPLVRRSDFSDWQGHIAKLETSVLIDGRKRFRGRIAGVDGDGIVIERDTASYGDEPTARIAFDAIAEARLVLTDDLVRDALKQDKKLRQQRKKARRKPAAPDGEERDLS
ncbi:MAG: ribosome maturation factor RimP [Rhizobiaceae bacterium]